MQTRHGQAGWSRWVIRPLRAAAMALVLAAAAAATANADPARWGKLVSQDACTWLEPAAVDKLLGGGTRAAPFANAAETGCRWTTAKGNPVLTVAILKWSSAANLVAERDGLLQQIRDYGGNRFEELPAPGGVASIVIRNDRGRVTLFPRANRESTGISINPHFVLREAAPEKQVRRERALAYTRELVKRHGL